MPRAGAMLLEVWLLPLLGLLVGFVGASNETDVDLGEFEFLSNDTLDGSICSPDLAIFDCNVAALAGAQTSNTCADFPTVEDCLEKCRESPECRYVTYGWDTTGYNRCITFYACPDLAEYNNGDPNLYYRSSVQAAPETTYSLVHEEAFCEGNVLFDCFNQSAAPNLIPTYRSCHPEYYNFSSCQAECDNRVDCNYMLWGLDWGGDFYRCTLFSSCSSPYNYTNGDVQVWQKPAIAYTVFLEDRICAEEQALFDCLDATKGGGDCSPYTSQYVCESVCSDAAACRFYTWGWDETAGLYRCATFSSCRDSWPYDSGNPNTYGRPTAYELVRSNAICSGFTRFDCITSSDPSTVCSQFALLSDCEAICDMDPMCNYMIWGSDPGLGQNGLGWRCATFDQCDSFNNYDNGNVDLYEHKGLRTTLPYEGPLSGAPRGTPLWSKVAVAYGVAALLFSAK